MFLKSVFSNFGLVSRQKVPSLYFISCGLCFNMCNFNSSVLFKFQITNTVYKGITHFYNFLPTMKLEDQTCSICTGVTLSTFFLQFILKKLPVSSFLQPPVEILLFDPLFIYKSTQYCVLSLFITYLYYVYEK